MAPFQSHQPVFLSTVPTTQTPTEIQFSMCCCISSPSQPDDTPLWIYNAMVCPHKYNGSQYPLFVRHHNQCDCSNIVLTPSVSESEVRVSIIILAMNDIASSSFSEFQVLYSLHEHTDTYTHTTNQLFRIRQTNTHTSTEALKHIHIQSRTALIAVPALSCRNESEPTTTKNLQRKPIRDCMKPNTGFVKRYAIADNTHTHIRTHIIIMRPTSTRGRISTTATTKAATSTRPNEPIPPARAQPTGATETCSHIEPANETRCALRHRARGE